MYVMTENKLTSVQIVDPATANNIEDSNFPAVNMIDQHPKKVAKATQNLAKVIASGTGWFGGFLILNVGCPTITNLRVYNSDGTIYEEDTVQLVKASSYYNYYHAQISTSDRYYVLFDNLYPDITIEFILNYADGEIAYIGLLFSGTLYKIGTAEWGLQDIPEDFSLIKETINGSTIIIKRDVLKSKNYKVFSTKAEYEQFYKLAIQNRDNFWVFIPTKEDIEFEDSFVKYGALKELPQVIQDNLRYIKYDFTVKEVL